jgi:hypothetical protein
MPPPARSSSSSLKEFYIAGVKSYRRAPTFLKLTGYEQVRSIAAALAGDLEAAAQVELVLSETGVTKSRQGWSTVSRTRPGETPLLLALNRLPLVHRSSCCRAAARADPCS